MAQRRATQEVIYTLLDNLQCNVPAGGQFQQLLHTIPGYSSQYIEIRLSGSDQVDFLYSINGHSKPDLLRLPELTAAAITRSLKIAPGIESFWIEYDDIGRLAEGAAANWHARINTGIHSQSGKGSNISSVEAADILLHGAGGNNQLRAYMCSLFNIIGQYGQLIHISKMQQRQPASYKLFVRVQAARLVSLLDAVDWQGDLAQLSDLLNLPWLKAANGQFISLDFRIDSELAPYIAIVQSRIYPKNGASDLLPVASLIEQDVLLQDRHIKAALYWLDGAQIPGQFRWLDIKTSSENAQVQTKLYFGIQNQFTGII